MLFNKRGNFLCFTHFSHLSPDVSIFNQKIAAYSKYNNSLATKWGVKSLHMICGSDLMTIFLGREFSRKICWQVSQKMLTSTKFWRNRCQFIEAWKFDNISAMCESNSIKSFLWVLDSGWQWVTRFWLFKRLEKFLIFYPFLSTFSQSQHFSTKKMVAYSNENNSLAKKWGVTCRHMLSSLDFITIFPGRVFSRKICWQWSRKMLASAKYWCYTNVFGHKIKLKSCSTYWPRFIAIRPFLRVLEGVGNFPTPNQNRGVKIPQPE